MSTYNRIQDVRDTANDLCEVVGYDNFLKLTPEDIDYIATETQCNYQGVCEILAIPLPAELMA
jgi:hypothetical protein